MNRKSRLTAILLGGLVAGTVDIGAATLISHRHDPVLILHVIASGLIGAHPSLNGGLPTALLGLILQWLMSLMIAAIFVVVAGYLPVLRRLWLAAGLAFGMAVFFVMNYVVVPLSALHQVPQFTTRGFLINMLAMLVFGTIIAWFARAE